MVDFPALEVFKSRLDAFLKAMSYFSKKFQA